MTLYSVGNITLYANPFKILFKISNVIAVLLEISLSSHKKFPHAQRGKSNVKKEVKNIVPYITTFVP